MFAYSPSLLQMLLGNRITEKVAKEAIIAYLTKGTKPMLFVEKGGLAKDLSEKDIENAVEKAMKDCGMIKEQQKPYLHLQSCVSNSPRVRF